MPSAIIVMMFSSGILLLINICTQSNYILYMSTYEIKFIIDNDN